MASRTRITSCLLAILAASQHLSHAYHHHNGKARVKRQTSSSVTCDSRSRYSRIDGYCHNLQHPAWGAADTPLKREEYLTSQQTPRLTSSSGRLLPSPRLVSTTYHSPLDDRSDVTLMLMQFGQFLDHDITLTPHTELDASINCCTSSNEACLPISIPSDDEHFQGLDCMDFVRSERHTDTELSTPTLQQSNALTSYIDGSMIYGSSEAELEAVRDFSNNDGMLKITDLSKGDYLPDDPSTACEADQSAGEYCFLAGDVRVNEQAGLAAMHTIFMREHNRIARKLKAENSRWSGNTIFEETRKIMGAVIQKIANDEFHPLVLGTKNQQTEEYKYNPDLQANILNSFATAAYRFGHSLIPEELVITGHGSVLFKDLFFDPTMVLDALDGLTETLKDDPAMGADGRFSHSITRHLFETEPKTGFDLVALNIQRGRDHHIPTYNRMRELCGLPRVDRLRDLFGRRSDNVYESIDDVDLFTGGMTESPVEGGLVGETFACVLNDQFHRLRMGDRLWYENTEGQAAFSNNQIEEIKKMSLAKIICENSENKRVQRNIFKPATSGRGGNNPIVDCEDIADINIDHWRGAVSDNGNGNDNDNGNGNGGDGGPRGPGNGNDNNNGNRPGGERPGIPGQPRQPQPRGEIPGNNPGGNPGNPGNPRNPGNRGSNPGQSGRRRG